MNKNILAILLCVTMTLFGVGLESDKADRIGSDLIVKDSQYKLVFFGYAGCYHFCDPRLRQIDPIYEALKGSRDITVLFIDISDTTSLPESQVFVRNVNDDFTAINPNNDDVVGLQQRFQDLFIRKLPDGEYLHSGFLYLLERHEGEYYLLKTYLEFTDTKRVVADIKTITQVD
jgi:protein SCO1/2